MCGLFSALGAGLTALFSGAGAGAGLGAMGSAAAATASGAGMGAAGAGLGAMGSAAASTAGASLGTVGSSIGGATAAGMGSAAAGAGAGAAGGLGIGKALTAIAPSVISAGSSLLARTEQAGLEALGLDKALANQGFVSSQESKTASGIHNRTSNKRPINSLRIPLNNNTGTNVGVNSSSQTGLNIGV